MPAVRAAGHRLAAERERGARLGGDARDKTRGWTSALVNLAAGRREGNGQDGGFVGLPAPSA